MSLLRPNSAREFHRSQRFWLNAFVIGMALAFAVYYVATLGIATQVATYTIIVAILIAPAAFAHLTIGWLFLSRRARRRRVPECPRCGYALKGLKSGQCPECGIGFGGHAINDECHRYYARNWMFAIWKSTSFAKIGRRSRG